MTGSETHVIMPVLGMSQDTGKILHWLKQEGEAVRQGEPLIEVETDKAVVEIEAPASGILTKITAVEGQEVPVAQVIAVIASMETAASAGRPIAIQASPLAARIAAGHQIDLSLVKPEGGKIDRKDVLAYLQSRQSLEGKNSLPGKVPASPKARRLAAERGFDLVKLSGSGPGGAVLAADVLSSPGRVPAAGEDRQTAPAAASLAEARVAEGRVTSANIEASQDPGLSPVSTLWRIMAERTTAAWTTIPHFFLLREVNASRLLAWREQAQKFSPEKITFTDLLVKLAAAALRQHPRINSFYQDGGIRMLSEIHIGVAMAVEDGLVVPVIRNADRIGVAEIAAARVALQDRARASRLRPEDLQGGTFTISNLGMYGVDAFNAVLNPPQAAILAVGRITDRVVALKGQAAVQPVMILSASFDHRAVDGARGAQFLGALADLIEEPLGLIS